MLPKKEGFNPAIFIAAVFTIGVVVGYLAATQQLTHTGEVCPICGQVVGADLSVTTHSMCLCQLETDNKLYRDAIGDPMSREEILRHVSAWQNLLLRVDHERIE